MPRSFPPSEAAWTNRQFSMLRVGGTWAIPRSAIIFTRTGEREAALTAAMPFFAEMAAGAAAGRDLPATAEALLAFQQEDFWCIAARARAAGWTIKSRVAGIEEVEP